MPVLFGQELPNPQQILFRRGGRRRPIAATSPRRLLTHSCGFAPFDCRSDLYILCATLAVVVISGFDCDYGNVLHIERHQFTPDEVEEVFAGYYKVRRTRQKLYVGVR